MDFSPNEDQTMLLGELEKLVAPYNSKPTDAEGFVLTVPALEQALEESGYFELATMDGMGPVAAALAVERLARLPFCGEFALSMLVRPHLDITLPRPLAVIEQGDTGRFLNGAATLIHVDGERVGISRLATADTTAADSIYAYPMGRLTGEPEIAWLADEQAQSVKTWLRVAAAAELSGLIRATVDATVEHISVRKQFGRPLGTFQALRHRMAECEVLAGGVRRLMLKAAWSGDAGEAALAAFHAQDTATRLAYDAHQMMGAMGMTLEMPLHLWTYRMKALLSELGGRGGQSMAVASSLFAA